MDSQAACLPACLGGANETWLIYFQPCQLTSLADKTQTWNTLLPTLSSALVAKCAFLCFPFQPSLDLSRHLCSPVRVFQPFAILPSPVCVLRLLKCKCLLQIQKMPVFMAHCLKG
eukprot:1156369-Pelagomonas_calceolata.AAC.6